MLKELLEFLETFQPKGILLDTNLMVVYVVAMVDPQRVGRAKRTEAFQPKDAEFLLDIVPRYARRFTTPAILAETTNLLGHFFSRLSPSAAADLLAALRDEVNVLDECHVAAREISRDEALLRFGFTDLTIAGALRQNRFVVLTADASLAYLLEQRGLPNVNYNHLRF